MSKSLNKWIGVGTIGRDAEGTFTASGVSVVKFSLATNYRYKKGEEWVEETDWHNIVAWRKENLVPYLTKGTKVAVEGRYSNRSYQDKNGERKYISEVVCDDIVLLGGGDSKAEPAASRPPKAAPRKVDAIDEDIPF